MDKEFDVELTEDCYPMFKGSVLSVQKELKKHYKGIWSSMFGTYEMKVPKEICKKYRRPKPLYSEVALDKAINKMIMENPNSLLVKKIKMNRKTYGKN